MKPNRSNRNNTLIWLRERLQNLWYCYKFSVTLGIAGFGADQINLLFLQGSVLLPVRLVHIQLHLVGNNKALKTNSHTIFGIFAIFLVLDL